MQISEVVGKGMVPNATYDSTLMILGAKRLCPDVGMEERRIFYIALHVLMQDVTVMGHGLMLLIVQAGQVRWSFYSCSGLLMYSL